MQDAIVAAYAKPVPRYTSYPTAPHFHDGIGPDTYGRWLDANNDTATRVSLYLHIPYCDRLCWFCGCHTKQVRQYAPIASYLEALFAEIDLVAARLANTTISAVHFGGGSPTMLRPDDMLRLDAHLRAGFTFAGDAEISVEIDPNDMDESRLDALSAIGMTRASLGVQDFDPRVQMAINRIQTFEQTREVIDGLRARGVASVNLDMLYGLPHQTARSVLGTAKQVLSLAPDRVALFGYAHVPWMKTHQKMIDEKALPDARGRFDQAQLAAQTLLSGGLEAVGMDHFAQPRDSLAIAARTGTLRRNFQGYTTDAADILVGLGASSIGQFPQGIVQNQVPTADYARAVTSGAFATARGIELTDTDRMNAYVIERIMCDFAVSRADLTKKFGPAASSVFNRADAFLATHKDGLFEAAGGHYVVTPRGKRFVRHFAAVFDEYLNEGAARHSTAV
ncbi:oxygen-independent coproporphyrinogen III oxidase [Pelagibacterium halotolerans]|uniref:oxygen-independent coproporphyrinogen III oxidase n=1 Tax=Pelagibacterium halotolerans TaxID=531813 RepID=UPI00384AF015